MEVHLEVNLLKLLVEDSQLLDLFKPLFFIEHLFEGLGLVGALTVLIADLAFIGVAKLAEVVFFVTLFYLFVDEALLIQFYFPLVSNA